MVIAVVIAVLGALRTIFGGGGQVAAKMGTRIERRLDPSEAETASSVSWSEPDIEPGVGPVNSFGKKSAAKKARRIARNRPRIIIPKLPPELQLPPKPEMRPQVGFPPDYKIPDGKVDEKTVRLGENATVRETARFAAFQVL